MDGTIRLPTLTEREARRHTVRINQPEELVQISFGVTVSTTIERGNEISKIFYLVDDANLFIKAMAGAMAFPATKIDTSKFHFAEATTITIESVADPFTFEKGRD